MGASLLDSSGSWPWGESAAQDRSTIRAGGFSSIPTPTSWRAPRSRDAQPPPIPPTRDCSPLSNVADCGKSSVKCYASSSPVLSVSETSWTQQVQKAAAIDLLIQ
jgi:hypothetical protein